jgi:hypothetical protein
MFGARGSRRFLRVLGAAAYNPGTAHQIAGHSALWPAVVLVASLVLMVGFSVWWLRRGDDGQDGGWGFGGGSEGSPPEPPQPSWWPEFERDFASYVTARGRFTGGARLR